MIDIYSDTWATVKAAVSEMKGRAINDLIETSSNDNHCRGVISACTEILKLEERQGVEVTPSQEYF